MNPTLRYEPALQWRPDGAGFAKESQSGARTRVRTRRALRGRARTLRRRRDTGLPIPDHPQRLGGKEGIGAISEFLTGIPADATFDVERVLATVLFTDVVGSTEHATRLGDAAWRALLDRHDRSIRTELARYGRKEVDTADDGFFATFDGPARAVRCAKAICEAVHTLGLEVRAGVHTGEVTRRTQGYAGMAVHIGARVAGMAGPSEVLTSHTVRDLVIGSGIEFEDRGTHQLKGVEGEWNLLVVL